MSTPRRHRSAKSAAAGADPEAAAELAQLQYVDDSEPGIRRKCYIHPAIIDSYLDHSLVEMLKGRTEQELRQSLPKLPAEEAGVLAWLQRMNCPPGHATCN